MILIRRVRTCRSLERVCGIRRISSVTSNITTDVLEPKWKRIAKDISNNSRSETVSGLVKDLRTNIPPKFHVDGNAEPLVQLHQVVQVPLWTIYHKLSTRNFHSPYDSLNEVERKYHDRLMSTFRQKLYDTFKNYLKYKDVDPTVRKAEDMQIIDYFNPKLVNITQLIYQINNNNYPKNFMKFSEVNNKVELLTQMLSNILYKEYMALKISVTQPDNYSIDISNPAEWYPEARKMKRKIIMHVGPTNSGKTYNALKKLASSKSGYYAGPLRLLAREIYERFNQQGTSCNLITGEEIVPSINKYGRVSQISSGTIEMIPLHKKMDVCIIDEIQMIANSERGLSWSNAFLGVLAKEVHLCGEESAVPLIEKLVKRTGDELEVKTYKRLGKLTISDKPASLRALKKGDCIIAFSKKKILHLKCEIEQKSNLKVGIIYGALPPEIRTKEAQDFNSGKTDILVASDAVGMGLNLKIKRIIFASVQKYDGKNLRLLSTPAIKQIGGRAGRYSEEEGEVEGFVTALNSKDLQVIRRGMNHPTINLDKACIWPTDLVWKYYLSKYPSSKTMYDIVQTFAQESAQLKVRDYFLTDLDARCDILNLLLRDEICKQLNIEDQLKLSLAPINMKMASTLVKDTVYEFVQTIRKGESKTIFDFGFLDEQIIAQGSRITARLDETLEVIWLLEDFHKLVLIFMWLSQRWPTLFVDKEGAHDMKTLLEKRINQELINIRRMNDRRK
ncbi:P-loop containing nucleoside triphosphate hydrolase protein [Scheffersomyces amazonensis]|uniref:P-loop containing nucleoside triphosphate hydrolase protein n=1 Tax=Scheffersomyces amazonensis TaxID=1078765 RepID=UPI00315C9C7E